MQQLQQYTFNFYDELPEEIQWKPESVLLLRDGILADAIQQLFDAKCGNREKMDILAWLLETDLKSPFSFAVCCAAAGLDPDSLRMNAVSAFMRHRKPAGEEMRRQVLADAVALLLDPAANPKERARAVAWMGEAACDKPFGFGKCCKASGKDPGEVRREVFKAVEEAGRGAVLKALAA